MSTQGYEQQSDNASIIQASIIFDHDEAVGRLGSETLLQKITYMFLSNSPGLMDEIEKAISTLDADMIVRSAHTLGSSIAYFSAKRSSEAALRIENMGREEDLDQVENAFSTLQTEIESLREALSKLLPEEGRPRES